MKILIGFCLFASIHSFAISQRLDTLDFTPIDIVDGIYNKEHDLKRTRCFIDFATSEECVLTKRVWRSIQSDQIKNELFFAKVLRDKNSDSLSLWDVISTHVKSADFTVYRRSNPYADSLNDGGLFKYPIAVRENGDFYTDTAYAKELIENQLLFKEESGLLTLITSKVPPYGDSIYNDNGSWLVAYEPRKMIEYTSQDVIGYHLLEDWYFCKERNILDVKIIGIAPVLKNESTGETFPSELFWLYYPQCEPFFKEYALVPNEKYYFETLQDLFMKRPFVSTIYKQSNVFDQKLESYSMSLYALIVSEKIKDTIRTLEHDVWHF